MVKNTEEKKAIRNTFRKMRDSLPQEERKEASGRIAERILASDAFWKVRFVYCYAAFGSEADTGRLVEQALKLGKRVAFPRVRGRSHMEFCFVRSLADLAPGYRGIPEPGPWCRKAPVPFEETLVIVPGIAFDRSGGRIGYGGGFYDAYLAQSDRCIRAAAAFSAQITEEIPMGPFDVKMDMIVTEKELILCHGGSPKTR